ncbi:ECF RNA polymerase sigma factor SigK [Paeniglutamicibacter kerguelensis]|uniref:RNA polymerase sigma-70 factor (ECF subfamily) n=2 Tax=Paeniglutamicibacter kerguelensis TaxID=254788 RepID=A0ABS4X8H6_9MICC|nr:ECF RNA polymerase sigma factor SigK [Paeniglutamicibacter kerguelensis]MBP2384770.1 RNA polymerase sigma-70 factor (ECF subfamily) [Paeniglutamicibacter kerguelensis]
MSSHRLGEAEQVSVPTPEDLMLQIATGNENAFEELYDRLSSQVFGLIRRILKDEAQSEEVTQEVFVEAWQQATRFDAARGKAITWLLTLAHRRAVDRVRASQASKDRDLREGIKEFQESYDDVEETAIQHDESRRVLQALERLSETQRDAIQLAYFGGYTHIEVAELLKIPVGTAKTRIRDGMNRLRDLMGVA